MRKSKGLGPDYQLEAEAFDKRWDKGRPLTDEERAQAQAEHLALLDKYLGTSDDDPEPTERYLE